MQGKLRKVEARKEEDDVCLKLDLGSKEAAYFKLCSLFLNIQINNLNFVLIRNELTKNSGSPMTERNLLDCF